MALDGYTEIGRTSDPDSSGNTAQYDANRLLIWAEQADEVFQQLDNRIVEIEDAKAVYLESSTQQIQGLDNRVAELESLTLKDYAIEAMREKLSIAISYRLAPGSGTVNNIGDTFIIDMELTLKDIELEHVEIEVQGTEFAEIKAGTPSMKRISQLLPNATQQVSFTCTFLSAKEGTSRDIITYSVLGSVSEYAKKQAGCKFIQEIKEVPVLEET